MSDLISSTEALLKAIISPLELVMLLAVVGGGLYLMLNSRGIPLLKLRPAFKLLF